MESTVCVLLAELAEPPILVYSEYDGGIDKSGHFHHHNYASLGATLGNEQCHGSMRPMVYISKVTLGNTSVSSRCET